MTFFNIDKKETKIPSETGVYLMKDKSEKIIYIGKAKNLKNRIYSYYNLNSNHSIERNLEKTKLMINKVFEIEYILTDN